MEESDFVQKYGAINVEYIPAVHNNPLMTKPYALNYFHQGKLYRTSNERAPGKLELFLDLLYVGIVASIAEQLTERCDGIALLQYCILFIPVFTVWLDVTTFMNYYFNDDLVQRLFLLWITALLMIYANSTAFVTESHKATAMCVVPYILCRTSLAVGGLIVSVYEPKHREQLRLFCISVLIISPIYIVVIFIGNRAKVGVSILLLVCEHVCYMISSHPATKQKLRVQYGTALNIEHFVERFSSFYIIAIGEFLYTIVSGHPIGEGITVKLWKAVMILIIAYIYMWLYFNGDCSNKLVHALRRSLFTAILWIYLHVPLIASLILSADAALELLVMDEVHLRKEYEEELSLYGLAFNFSGGLLVALLSLSLLALCDKPMKDGQSCRRREQFLRILPRIPTAAIIVCLPLLEMKPARLIGLTTMLLLLLFIHEVYLLYQADKYSGISMSITPDDASANGTVSNTESRNSQIVGKNSDIVLRD